MSRPGAAFCEGMPPRRWQWTSIVHGVLAGALTGQVLAAPPDTSPVIRVVTTVEDEGRGSLRAALEEAAASPGHDRIVFGDAEGLFNTPQRIRLAAPLPPITGEVEIDGYIEGLLWRAYGVTIDASGRGRVFEVPAGSTLRLSSVTVTGGSASVGGGILNRGRLVIEGVTLMDNHAAEAGGAMANDGGDVVMINSTATGNRAPMGGAAANLDGRMRMVNSTLFENAATEGGALFNRGTVEVANSILAGSGEAQCVNAGPEPIVSTHNLITSGRQCGAPLLTSDPMLGPFGYFNGPTPLFAIASGSPVINLGDNAAAMDDEGRPLVWDQRGNGDPRFAAGFSDLGAFEQQAPVAAEFLVDTWVDNGLRGCNAVIAADCPLRAALELAGAAPKPTPIRFDPNVFDEPGEIHLGESASWGEIPLFLDGSGAAPVTVRLSGKVPELRSVNGVRIQFGESHMEGGG